MLTTIIALAVAAETGRAADGCPDSETLYGRILIEAGESCPRLKAAAKKRTVSIEEQAEIKKYFDAVLFDGLTARWQFESSKAGFICGNVNAKNRLGAYTGWTGFYYHKGKGSIVSDSTIAYDATCSNRKD